MKYVVVNQHTADGPEVAINLEQVIFAEPFPGKIIKVRFTDGKELSVYGDWEEFKPLLKAYEMQN